MPTYFTTRARTINNRRLKAGEEFTASARDGDLLVRLGRATRVPDALATTALKTMPPAPVMPPVPITPPVPAPAAIVTPESEASGEPPAPDVVDTLATAREDYQRIVGKRAFHGWDEAELRKRIAEFETGDNGSS